MKSIEAGCLAIIVNSGKGFTGRTVKVVELLLKGSTSATNVWHINLDEPIREGIKGWRADEADLMRIDGFKGKKAINQSAGKILEEAI